MFPLSILNISVLRSKGTVTRAQQPGGSGITQSIPVLGSANVGSTERRPIRRSTAAYPTRRIVSSHLFGTRLIPAQLVLRDFKESCMTRLLLVEPSIIWATEPATRKPEASLLSWRARSRVVGKSEMFHFAEHGRNIPLLRRFR